MGLKNRVRKLIFGAKADSTSFVKYLRSTGMSIGENTVVYSPQRCTIDQTRPWMIEIGSNVSITEGVTILTHGYDWSVFKGLYGEVLGSAGKVSIGNNVFVGVNTTILKGVSIGNNVIIGACSLINKDIPDNVVVAGNPQRIIMSIDEYLEKRRQTQVDEAQDLYDCYRRTFGEVVSDIEHPPREVFREFFWMFTKQDSDYLEEPSFLDVMRLCGTYEKSTECFRNKKELFDSYEAFCAYLAAHYCSEPEA